MREPRSRWTETVHHWALRRAASGGDHLGWFEVCDATAKFGLPPSLSAPSRLLRNAVDLGWFEARPKMRGQREVLQYRAVLPGVERRTILSSIWALSGAVMGGSGHAVPNEEAEAS